MMTTAVLLGSIPLAMAVVITIFAIRDEISCRRRPLRRAAYMDGWKASQAGEEPVLVEGEQKFADEGYRDGATGQLPQTVWTGYP